MKQSLTLLLMTLLLGSAANLAFADTAPDRSRAVVTRSADTVDRPERDRGSDETPITNEEENNDSDNDDDEGGGITLNVSYNNEGGVDVEFEANGDSGDANISITINGESVSGTGGQQEGGNTSSDGADGTDGADGNNSDESEEEEEEEGDGVEEEESGREALRPDREIDERDSTDRDRR